MSVYVDPIFDWPIENTPPGQARAVARRHGGRWCHMIADSEEELLRFATRLGLRLNWKQQWRGSNLWHFDLVPTKRSKAVSLGAVELGRLEFYVKVRELDGVYGCPEPGGE